MSWGNEKEFYVDGIKVRVSEDVKHRNHHGAMKYMVEVLSNGDIVHTEFCDQAKWLGHCFGQLFVQDVVARVAAKQNA